MEPIGRRPALAARRGARAVPRRATSCSAGAGWAPPWSPWRRPRAGPPCGRRPSTCPTPRPDSVLDLTVTLAAEGRRITQGRVVGRVGDTEILTVNAAAGPPGGLDAGGVWVHPARGAPARRVPAPSHARDSPRPPSSISSTCDWPRACTFEELTAGRTVPGDPTSALWARVPGHLEPSAATLAIIGDYVTGGVSQALGRRAMCRSLDNTLRVVRLEPTEWVLCDIRIQALVDGYGQGRAYLWSEDGTLLATASQSMSVRFWRTSGRRCGPDPPVGAGQTEGRTDEDQHHAQLRRAASARPPPRWPSSRRPGSTWCGWPRPTAWTARA